MAVYITYFIYSGFNKGFECSDESYYNIVSHDALNKHAFASNYGAVNETFTLSDADWVSMRIYKWAFQLISLLVFCFSLASYVFKKMEVESVKVWLLILTVFIAGWINYDYLPPGLSYNSWSLNCTFLLCSAFLIESTSKRQKQAVLAGLLHGSVFVILLSVKFPNAIFALLLYLVYKCFFWRKYFASSLLSFLFAGLLICPLIFGSYINAMKGIADVLTESYGVKHTGLSVYADQFIDYLKNGVGYLFIIIQASVLVLNIFLPLNFTRPITYLTIIYNFVFLFFMGRGNSYSVYNDYTFFLVFFISAFLIYRTEKKFDLDLKFRPSGKFILVVFLLIPFLMAAGTNNSIFYTAAQFGAFYVALAGLMLLKITKENGAITLAISGLLFSFLLLTNIRQGYLLTPYRQTPLDEKNLPMIFSQKLATVYESKERFVFFAELSARIKKCNPVGYPITSSFSYVGASLLADLPVLKCFWLPDPGYGLEKVRQHFQFCRFPSFNKMLIFSQKELNFPGYKDLLSTAGMNIDKDFSKCDSVYCKYNQEYVYLYLSKVNK